MTEIKTDIDIVRWLHRGSAYGTGWATVCDHCAHTCCSKSRSHSLEMMAQWHERSGKDCGQMRYQAALARAVVQDRLDQVLRIR